MNLHLTQWLNFLSFSSINVSFSGHVIFDVFIFDIITVRYIKSNFYMFIGPVLEVRIPW